MSLKILIININFDPRTLEGCERIAARLVALDPSVEVRVRPWRLILDASDALAPDLARWGPAAVILGPNETPFPAYPAAFDRFLSWVRARRGPTLGICGGHQALALAHGAPVAPVFPVPAATTSYAGLPKVSGPQRIRLFGDADPLTADLPEELTVMASHVDAVKDLPPGFRVLALGDPCHVQIIRADRRPMWGVQFHPERPPEDPSETDHGAVILRNFLLFSSSWRLRGAGAPEPARPDEAAAPEAGRPDEEGPGVPEAGPLTWVRTSVGAPS